MKKICIDARLLGNFGIGTYLSTLLENFPESQFHFSLIVRKKNDRISERFEQIIFDAKPYSLKEQLFLRFKIPKCDLFFIPHFNTSFFLPKKIKKVATIHDVALLADSSHLSFLGKLYANRLIKYVLQNFDEVLTVSQFSKKEIEERFKPAKKINVIYNGIVKTSELNVPKAFLPKPYFLCFYSEKYYKNFDLCIQAFYLLQKKLSVNVHLIVIGNYEAKDSRIISVMDVSKELLYSFYKEAQAVVIPSYYEGFGLPAIEAMQNKCPVIASSIDSLKEVCQEAAIYFDPHNPVSLMESMLLILRKKEIREEKISKGSERVHNFDAGKCAKEHLKIFEKVL